MKKKTSIFYLQNFQRQNTGTYIYNHFKIKEKVRQKTDTL